ncbi:MAG: hypothetical protein ACRC29_11985, partial [Enterobacterales bacterium]
MSFSFTEPTSTHPTEEVTTEEVTTTTTTEETTDVTNADTDTTGTDANQPGDGNGEGTEDAGREADGSDGAEGAPEGDQPKPDVPKEDAGEVEFYFGGEKVDIEVDPSHREAFEAKGLDIDALAAELYRKDGEFKLTDESYQKCCDAFGKFAIDALISGLKAQNEATASKWKHEAEARVKADEDRFNSLAESVGGTDGWNRLEEYALETLTD